MKLIRKVMRNRIWVFVSSVLIAAILLATCQIVVYAAKMDARDRQIDKIETVRAAEWNTVNVVIKDTIEKAGQKLEEEVIPQILADIKAYYGTDNDRLKYDLENLSNKKYDDPLVHILAKDISGKYLFNIESDNNDIFVLTKNDGIISDPSVSTSSPTRPQSFESEASGHYNSTLAMEAFNAIINQTNRVDNPVIFWQFFEPTTYTDDAKITEMNLSKLKQLFEEHDGDLASLDSFEFLVPKYIFFDQDLLGNKLVDDRGIRQDIYQIIVVQGFNVKEIIEKSDIYDSIYTGIDVNNISDFSEFVSMNRVQQILIFIGLFAISFWIQFSTSARRKYMDEDEDDHHHNHM